MTSASPHFHLEGHRVLITGGTRGIGAAIATTIANSGGDVMLVGYGHPADGQQTVADCRAAGVQAETLECDLSEPATRWLDELVAAVDRLMPDIDCLVNNVGTFLDRPFLQMTPERYATTMNLNVASGYFLTQAFARRWVERGVAGRVVFTGSINGFLAEPDHTAYDTSKGAVAAMVRSLCVALAPHRIRVNSMAPGLIRTPLTDVVNRDATLEAWMQHHTPNRKIPQPDACGGTVAFLLSDAADHIHGQTILVDGGMSAWQQPDPPQSDPV